MKITSTDISSAKTYAEVRFNLAKKDFSEAFKNRHNDNTIVGIFTDYSNAESEFRNLRKMKTILDSIYLLEDKLGYGE